jgi:hypothetical protein
MSKKESHMRLLMKVSVIHIDNEITCRPASALHNKPARELLGTGQLLGVLSELPCVLTYITER